MGDERQRHSGLVWGPALVSVVTLLVVGVIALILYDYLYPGDLGIRQPIPFSHRVHVHVKKLSCLMCHTQVTDTARAGIPPLETCLLCHQRIIRTFPYIADLREHYRQGKPIVWERVNWVPEFVYFNHSMHIRRSIDCSRCHGNVGLMDRVVKAEEFRMGFCIQCHRENNATHDCFTCHR